MPKRQSGCINSNVAVSSKFNEIEYEKVVKVYDNLDAVKVAAEGINARSNITYGEGVPAENINPITGINAFYLDNLTDNLYICKDATKDSNVWLLISTENDDENGQNSSANIKEVFTDLSVGQQDIICSNTLSASSDIFVNGALLSIENSDYSVSGNTLTLTTPIGSTDDVVVVITNIDSTVSAGGGQYLGSTSIKAIGYTLPYINETINLGTLNTPLHGFAIDSLLIDSTGQLIVEDKSLIKIL